MKFSIDSKKYVLDADPDIKFTTNWYKLAVETPTHEIAFQPSDTSMNNRPSLTVWLYRNGEELATGYANVDRFPATFTMDNISVSMNLRYTDRPVFDIEIERIPWALTRQQEIEGMDKYTFTQGFYSFLGGTPYICPHCACLLSEFIEMAYDPYIGAADYSTYVCLNCGAVFSEAKVGKLEQACVWVREDGYWISRICEGSKPVTKEFSRCMYCNKKAVFEK